ncbi:hypothetical protein N0824_03926 [Microcystis sp. 0824]|nr:hypothetical protein N0824_03926 [Microcystis sp. 0824]
MSRLFDNKFPQSLIEEISNFIAIYNTHFYYSCACSSK